MKRYEQLAHDIAGMIKSGVLAPGERVPSVRHASQTYSVSPATVYRAYYLLEDKGLILSRPRSGYFVCSQSVQSIPSTARKPGTVVSTVVDVSELVFTVLGSVRNPEIVPLGSAFPSPTLFPMQRLSRSLGKATREMDLSAMVAHLPAGSLELRRQIAQRYSIAGTQVDFDELVITNGALEALNLCLQAVTEPGDYVAVEAPAFYASLQALERLNLKAVEIPVDPKGGADLQVLEEALARHPVKACWFMTSFQNPTGASMSDDNKRALVDLLTKHQVPLIEDDVYNELYFGREQPKPAKAFDSDGYVMHCSSFSKSLAPGYRIGWVAAGRFARQIERARMMTTLSASTPAQVAIADYLQSGGYDRHLRKLRHKLEVQQNVMRAAIGQHFPASTRVSRPDGGYFLWLELPPGTDSLRFLKLALEQQISIAPGPIFSANRAFGNCIRLNYGAPSSAAMTAAISTLGRIAHSI